MKILLFLKEVSKKSKPDKPSILIFKTFPVSHVNQFNTLFPSTLKYIYIESLQNWLKLRKIIDSDGLPIFPIRIFEEIITVKAQKV